MTAIEETEIYKELCEVYGVRKLGCRGTVKQNIPCEYGNEIWQKCKKEGLECDEKEFHYPLFTTKKQLELIKLVINIEDSHCSFYKDEGVYTFEFFYGDCMFSSVNPEAKTFEEVLVLLIIQMTEYLDHAKVKEILEG
jgi:hypothetical protein